MTLQRMEHTGAAPQTTLQAQMGAADGSFTVVAGANYPTGAVGPFIIIVDPGLNGEEKIKCSSRSGNTFTVATSGRGYDNTTAGIHTQGANVQHVLGAIEVDDDNEHIYNTARDDHTQYARTDGTRAFSGGVTITTGGLTVTGNETLTGNETVSGTITAGGATTGLTVVASGLTGATAASRHVGATASGPPLTGTFAVGDFVIDQSGTVWVCTAAGTPGTWAAVAKDAAVVHLAGTETVTGAKTFSQPLVGQSSITGQTLIPSGLTGAVAASRYVGATTSGPPISGTFAVGDWVVDQTGLFFVCVVAGTPGTWSSGNRAHCSVYLAAVQAIVANTLSIMKFDTVPEDPLVMYNAATGVFTVPVAGRYHIDAQLTYSSAATSGQGLVAIASAVPAEVRRGNEAVMYTGQPAMTVSGTIRLAANGTFTIAAFNSVPGGINTLGGGGGAFNYCDVQYLGN